MSQEEFNQIIAKIRKEDTRWDAILQLKLGQGEEWVDPLIGALKDSEWVVRWCCAEKLGDMKPEKALKPLLALLADPDGHVRKNAMNALCKYGPDSLVTIVSYMAIPNVFIRRNIHLIIQKYGEAGIPALEKAIPLRSKVVANQIVHAIWSIGGVQAEQSMIRLLHYTYLQKNIIILLGNMNSQFCIPYLVQLFKKPSLKRPILHTLGCIGEEVAFQEVVNLVSSQKSAISQGALEVARRIGKAILPTVIDAFDDPDAKSERLISLLDRIGPGSVLDKLEFVVAKHPDLETSIRALITKHEVKGEGP